MWSAALPGDDVVVQRKSGEKKKYRVVSYRHKESDFYGDGTWWEVTSYVVVSLKSGNKYKMRYHVSSGYGRRDDDGSWAIGGVDDVELKIVDEVEIYRRPETCQCACTCDPGWKLIPYRGFKS